MLCAFFDIQSAPEESVHHIFEGNVRSFISDRLLESVINGVSKLNFGSRLGQCYIYWRIIFLRMVSAIENLVHETL